MSHNSPWNIFADGNLGDQYVQDSENPDDSLPPPYDTPSYEDLPSNSNTLPQSDPGSSTIAATPQSLAVSYNTPAYNYHPSPSHSAHYMSPLPQTDPVGSPYLPPGYGNCPDAFNPHAFSAGSSTVATTPQSSALPSTPAFDYGTFASPPVPIAGEQHHFFSMPGSTGSQKDHTPQDPSAPAASAPASAEERGDTAYHSALTPERFVQTTMLGLQRAWNNMLEDVELAGGPQYAKWTGARSFASVETDVQNQIRRDIRELRKGDNWVNGIPQSFESAELKESKLGRLTWRLVTSDNVECTRSFNVTLPKPLAKKDRRR